MKIEYNNLYTHFILTTYKRMAIISEKNRERIEKYITRNCVTSKFKIICHLCESGTCTFF